MNDKELIANLRGRAETLDSWNFPTTKICTEAADRLEVLSTSEPEPSEREAQIAVYPEVEAFLSNLHDTPAWNPSTAADDLLDLLVERGWRAVAPVEVTPEPSDKVIREFHGNNVWRDPEGVIWMRLDEALEMRNLDTVAPVEVTRDELAKAWDEGWFLRGKWEFHDQRFEVQGEKPTNPFRVSRRDGEDKK